MPYNTAAQTVASSRSHCTILPLAALAGAALCLLTAPVRGELLIGLTTQNSLISFDSATPGTLTSALTITGVVAGDTLFGIDRRPQGLPNGSPGVNNGLLYAFAANTTTGAGRIYTLNTTTGFATPGALLSADPSDTTAPFPFVSVQGTEFGIDFNPVPDRLRVVSNTGQNLRINVDNGLVQLDGPLAYQSGDPRFGLAPDVTSVAYSNNFGGATTTTLRGVDVSDPDRLVIHTNPNGGTLMTSLLTGVNSGEVAGYDISGITETPYFAFTTVGGPSTLFTISGGGFTSLGTIGGNVPLRGLAAPVGIPRQVPDSSSTLLALFIALGGLATFSVLRRSAA